MTLIATTFAAAAVWVQTTTPAPAPQDVREILRFGDAAAISAWLNQDPSAAKRPDAEGFQPIHWAAFFGKREAIELLIARGADPGASCRLGTALHAAALAGHVDIVRWLTARGVDPNATAEEIPPPLAIAVRRGNLPLVEALSQGVPVIASDLPVFREIAGGIPDYVSPLDGMGWMERIEAYSGPFSSARAGQLERVRGFAATTWQEHFDAVEGLLERLGHAP